MCRVTNCCNSFSKLPLKVTAALVAAGGCALYNLPANITKTLWDGLSQGSTILYKQIKELDSSSTATAIAAGAATLFVTIHLLKRCRSIDDDNNIHQAPMATAAVERIRSRQPRRVDLSLLPPELRDPESVLQARAQKPSVKVWPSVLDEDTDLLLRQNGRFPDLAPEIRHIDRKASLTRTNLFNRVFGIPLKTSATDYPIGNIVSTPRPAPASLDLARLHAKKDRIIQRALFHMDQICNGYQKRLEAARQSFHAMDSGLFHARAYVSLLLLWAPTNEAARDRLNNLKERNAFLNGVFPPQFEIPGKQNVECRYCVLKQGESPSQAIKVLLTNGFAFVDSLQVCQLALYLALLDVQGEAWFDAAFAANGENPLVLGGAAKNLITTLYKSTDVDKAGNIKHYGGPDTYRFKHLLSAKGGLTTMCMGDKRLQGYGFNYDLCRAIHHDDAPVNKLESYNDVVLKFQYLGYEEVPLDIKHFIPQKTWEAIAEEYSSGSDTWNQSMSFKEFIQGPVYGTGCRGCLDLEICDVALHALLSSHSGQAVALETKEHKALVLATQVL